ncbi:MAG: DsbE family thiol:disulfide interchange protein [Gammaproteobacteria bacterium]
MKRSLLYLLPIVVLAGLIGFFWRGLYLNPRILPSPLIGKSVPVFSLSELRHPEDPITQQSLMGHVSLVNVWGTWCYACREEQQTLMAFARQHVVPIYGWDYKDDRQAALAWLAERGDPYAAIAFDASGDAAINWGVYGAPETFLIDARGIIRYKYVGPLTPDVIQKDLLPRIQALQHEGR